jgi:hypothetical protein
MAYVRQDCVGERQWLSDEEFKEGMALCRVIPGATVMQMAAYVGYHLGGLPGAGAAALAFDLPGFLLLTVLSATYFFLGNLPSVRLLFTWLAATVVASGCRLPPDEGGRARATLDIWAGIPFTDRGAAGERLPRSGHAGRRRSSRR